jgi:hypothetical protein
MKKIFNFLSFVNESYKMNEAVSIPQVINDFVDFIEESPVVEMYPDDSGETLRQGWITKEHKLYSLSGIKNYFEEKYGDDYSSNDINIAVNYAPNIKKLEELLTERGLSLQVTNIKASYGDTYPFYSVSLSDSERNQIKEEYEEEFKKRNELYYSRRLAGIQKSKKIEEDRPRRGGVKKNEAIELLIESLFSL